MKAEFHEDLVTDSQDPLDGQIAGFDFDQIDRILAGHKADLGSTEFERLGIALNAILSWVIGDPRTPKKSERAVARRLIGLAWTINPAFFEDSPSLTDIAKRLGIHKVVLSLHSAQAHRHFGIKNRAQSHGWNFKPQESDALPAHNDDTNEPEENDHEG